MAKPKYLGMDVHKDTISVAAIDSTGKLITEAVLETKAEAILSFVNGLRRNIHITFEEATWATWLYELLQPHAEEIVVCNPRMNALLTYGNKADQSDARKLAELLRGNFLKPVYHGGTGMQALKELTRSYNAISKDLVRVMTRLKAIYRSRGISCAGTRVYRKRYREEWLAKILEPGARRRAEHYYQQLDALTQLRLEARHDLLNESRKHSATELLCQIPCIGPIRAAQLIALIQTPHRFRTKRQLWTYSGLAVDSDDSAQYCFVNGRAQLSPKKLRRVRGLNRNFNHDLKDIFKGAAVMASITAGPFRDFYQAQLARGRRPAIARLTLARKIAAITLVVWKKGVKFDAQQVAQKAA